MGSQAQLALEYCLQCINGLLNDTTTILSPEVELELVKRKNILVKRLSKYYAELVDELVIQLDKPAEVVNEKQNEEERMGREEERTSSE